MRSDEVFHGGIKCVAFTIANLEAECDCLKGFDERTQDLSPYLGLFYDGDAHASLSLHDRGRWFETPAVISCSESGRKSNQFFCDVDLDFLCRVLALGTAALPCNEL
jgi:hypothetical protein